MYTSQRQEAGLGLYFYNARWYDPYLARFTQADTIVPGAGNPQAFDRFAYVLGNPLKYSDPSGHGCYYQGNYIPDTSACNWISNNEEAPVLQTQPPVQSTMPTFNAWNSNQYSGCFMCHAAVANGQFALTDEQLTQAHENMTTWQAIAYTPVMVTIGAVGIAEVAPSAALACLAFPLCAAAIGAGSASGTGSTSSKGISDNAFVRFDPTKFDSSIEANGLLTRFSSDNRIWLTQFKYVKNITNPIDLETILYRKDLWVSMAGKFANGATLRQVNISGAVPAGVTNMTNGIPQWYITSDVPPNLLEVVWRLFP